MNRLEAFMLGQDKGKENLMLTTRDVDCDLVGTYALGWSVGWSYVRFRGPLVSKPDWMTPEQFGAIVGLYMRHNLGMDFPAFFQKVENYGDHAGLMWNGMFLGIEKDGYTHS